jgi:hypothetical protein
MDESDKKYAMVIVVAVVLLIGVPFFFIAIWPELFANPAENETVNDAIVLTHMMYETTCTPGEDNCSFVVSGTWLNQGKNPYTFSGEMALVDNYSETSEFKGTNMTLPPGHYKTEIARFTVPRNFSFSNVTTRVETITL